MTMTDLDDLIGRLEHAEMLLTEKANDPTTGKLEKARLNGKVEGVKLALSYVREIRAANRLLES